jgi:hypothetical protein
MLNDFDDYCIQLPFLMSKSIYRDFTSTSIEFNSICPTSTVPWKALDGRINENINISFNHRYLTGPSLHGAHSALDTRNFAHQRAMPLLQHLQRILRAVVSCAHINQGSHR